MRIALFQPDIAQNVGAAIRVAACFGAGVDLIGPMGFPAGEREIRRVAMDYAAAVQPRLVGEGDDGLHYRLAQFAGALGLDDREQASVTVA